MKKKVLVLSAILATATAAFGAGRVTPVSEALKLSVSAPVVESGSEVTVTLQNVSGDRWFVGGCLFGLVREGACDGDVVRSIICTAEMKLLNPGEEKSQTWDLTDNAGDPVALGEYHLPVHAYTLDGRQATLCARTTVVLFQGEPGGVSSAACDVFFYGDVGHGSGHVGPVMWPVGAPKVGNEEFVLHAQGGLGGAPAFVLLGAEKAQIRASIGVLAIDLAAPFLVLPVQLRGAPDVPGAGVLDIAMPIPGDPRLAGVAFYGQLLVADPHASGGYSHSGGMAITLCD